MLAYLAQFLDVANKWVSFGFGSCDSTAKLFSWIIVYQPHVSNQNDVTNVVVEPMGDGVITGSRPWCNFELYEDTVTDFSRLLSGNWKISLYADNVPVSHTFILYDDSIIDSYVGKRDAMIRKFDRASLIRLLNRPSISQWNELFGVDISCPIHNIECEAFLFL